MKIIIKIILGLLILNLGAYQITGNGTKENIEPKETKSTKETIEPKETKETKETKEPKETKETKEPEETKEPKETKSTKETIEPKETKETKETKESEETKETKATKTSYPPGCNYNDKNLIDQFAGKYYDYSLNCMEVTKDKKLHFYSHTGEDLSWLYQVDSVLIQYDVCTIELTLYDHSNTYTVVIEDGVLIFKCNASGKTDYYF